MKKISIIFMSAVAASMVMVGCGNKGNGNDSVADMVTDQDTLTTTTMVDDAVAPAAADAEGTEATEVAVVETEEAPAEPPVTEAAAVTFTMPELAKKLTAKADIWSITPSDGTSVMESLGFDFVGKSNTSDYNDLDGTYEPATKMTYKNGDDTIDIVYNDAANQFRTLTINFGNKADADNFYKGKKNQVINGTAWNMKKSGSKITISVGEYQ